MTLSLFITGLIVVMVICRYLLHIPLMWVEELATYVAFWFFFLGAAYATYKHLNIEGGIVRVVFKDKPSAQLGFQAAISAMGVGLSCVLAVWSYDAVYWSLFGPGPPLTGVLYLPLGWSQLSFFVGFSLMVLYFLVEFIQTIRVLTQKHLI